MFAKLIIIVRKAVSQAVGKWKVFVGLPVNSWLASVVKVSGVTMVARVFGFVRDFSFAVVFGSSPWLESFLVSFRLPNMFRRVLGEGMTSIIVPVFTEIKEKDSQNRFIQSMMLALLFVTGVVWLIVALSPIFFVKIVAAGFADDERLLMTAQMLPWSFGYLCFIAWIALLSGVLNAHKSFVLPAAVPLGLSVGLLIGSWLIYSLHGQPIWLSYSALAAGFIQVGYMLWVVRQYGFRFQWPHVWHPGVRKVLALLFAAWIGLAASQISVFIDTWLASWLPPGCISWLYYSERLVYLPQGTVGVAIATVLLPGLSKADVTKDKKTYDDTLASGLVFGVRLGVPLMLVMVVLAEPLVIVVFGHGRFGLGDIHATAQSLIAMVLGLPFMMMNKLLVASYFAKKLVRYSVIATLISVTVNTVIAVAFMHRFEHIALAVAVAAGSFVSVLYLLWCHPSRQTLYSRLNSELRTSLPWWLVLIGALYIVSSCMTVEYGFGVIKKSVNLILMVLLPLLLSWLLMKSTSYFRS